MVGPPRRQNGGRRLGPRPPARRRHRPRPGRPGDPGAAPHPIGEYIAVARRNGSTWYLGAMTNESSRTLSLPLSFLGGGTWTATVYADGTLDVAMAPAGGQAVVLKPG
ncbi:glycoside hydrolase family 97 C-terminal domain-containing protein [Streptomyces iakyrus]|uniref:glycoside hydrolase family 97 C-terminal domain-containing protein n=1 Tax=Streptomyces iakyrus TaxID=68219 RepID=UPI003683D422